MPTISHRRITSPQELGGDGLGLADAQHYDVDSCIIDLAAWPLEMIDEAAGILRPSTYIPGVCRALTATDGGTARARGCRSLKWWIAPLPGNWARMDKGRALALVRQLEDMAETLDAALAA